MVFKLEDTKPRRRNDVFKPVQKLPDKPPTHQPAPPPKPKPAKTKKPVKKVALALLIILLLIGVGFFGYAKLNKKQPAKHYFPATITQNEYNLPAYYPTQLPGSYKVGGFSMIKKNILYYNVTNANSEKFNITLQKLSPAFDFTAFKKKFVKPDEYNTPIGSNLVGVAGTTLIGSIQTNDNVWIILNSESVNATKDMETITRSLRKVEL